MAKEIVALSVEEGEHFEIYIPGPNPSVADPAGIIGSSVHSFVIMNGQLFPDGERHQKTYHTSFYDAKLAANKKPPTEAEGSVQNIE